MALNVKQQIKNQGFETSQRKKRKQNVATQGKLSNWKICFNVFNIRTYYEILCNLSRINKLYNERPVLTSQFDISKLQKHLRSVIQIHLDQSVNFGPLPLNVCVTVSHNISFNSINR